MRIARDHSLWVEFNVQSLTVEEKRGKLTAADISNIYLDKKIKWQYELATVAKILLSKFCG
jgi:hypothetical protein